MPVATEVTEKPAGVKEEVAQLVTDKAVENSGRFSWPHYATRESIEAYEEELYLPEDGEEDDDNEGAAMSNVDIDALCSAFEGKLKSFYFVNDGIAGVYPDSFNFHKEGVSKLMLLTH